MHFVYIDDSGDEAIACFSAIIIPADQWRESLDHLLCVRQQMRDSDGIYLKSEIHSTDWNGGKGAIARKPVLKPRRAQLFDFFLAGIATIPSVQLINAAVPRNDKDRAFEWLLQRIQVNMEKAGSRCVVFCDEGKSYDAVRRKMGVFNFIRSKFGDWGDGKEAINIPARRLLEDLVYRDSARSIFIQAADACAYALLRRERPIPSKTTLGLDQSFFLLERIMVKQAFGADPHGIIR